MFEVAYQVILKGKMSNIYYKQFENEQDYETWKMDNIVKILGITSL